MTPPTRIDATLSELEINKLSGFIAHSDHDDSQHRRNQEAARRRHEPPVVVRVARRILGDLHSEEQGHSEKRRKFWLAGAVIEMAEVCHKQLCEMNDLPQRMRAKQKPSVTNDNKENDDQPH